MSVADHEHEKRLDEAQPEDDPERSEHPVDRGDVGARPDPELLQRRRVAVGRRNRFDPVRVQPDVGRLLCHGHSRASRWKEGDCPADHPPPTGRSSTAGRRRNYAPSVALVLRNGLVDVGGGRFERGDVAVADGRIVARNSLDYKRRSSTARASPSCRAWSTRTRTRTRTGSAGSGTTCRSSRGCSSRTRCSRRRRSRADEIYVRTLLGGIEMLRSGATTRRRLPLRATRGRRSSRSFAPTATSACAR